MDSRSRQPRKFPVCRRTGAATIGEGAPEGGVLSGASKIASGHGFLALYTLQPKRASDFPSEISSQGKLNVPARYPSREGTLQMGVEF